MAWSVCRTYPATESVLTLDTGTRWLTRWDKELDLLVKLAYHGVTSGRGSHSLIALSDLNRTHLQALQTLGEEYTDIWQYSVFSHRSNRTPPSPRFRACYILLPTLSAYGLNKLAGSSSFREQHPRLDGILKKLSTWLEVMTEINLAVFYLKGTYHDLTKRIFGIRHVSSIKMSLASLTSI